MVKPRAGINEIAEILIDKLGSLTKDTTRIEKAVERAEKMVLEVNQKPLEEFNQEFRRTMQDYERIGKKKFHVPKWIMVVFIFLAFSFGIACITSMHFYSESTKWKERAVELGYKIPEPSSRLGDLGFQTPEPKENK